MADVAYTEARSDSIQPPRGRTLTADNVHYAKLLSGWYLLRQGRFWCFANIFAAGLVDIFVWEKINPTLLASWSIFIVLNAFLLLSLISREPGKDDSTTVKDDPVLFFAAIFGGAWGGLMFLAGPTLEPPLFLALQLVVISISGMAIPLFALHNGAFTIFSVSLIIPSIAVQQQLSAASGFNLFYALFFVLYLTAAYFSATQRTLATMIEKFLTLAGTNTKNPHFHWKYFTDIAYKRYRKIERQLPLKIHAKESLDAIADGVITVNDQGIIEYINPIAEVMLGINHDDALGQHVESLLNVKCDEAEALLSNNSANLLDTASNQFKCQTTLVRSDGVKYQVELTIISISDDHGKFDGASVILREIPRHNGIDSEFNWRSGHDPLTKLLNRVEFHARLKKVFDDTPDPSEKSHAVCIFDLDNFKYLNESLGHQGGDQALVQIAQEFKSKIRGADILARTGDDKFAVLLFACGGEKARMIADGLRRITENTTIEYGGKSIKLTLSAGVVSFNTKRDSLTDVLIAAETACTNAKKQGGNRVFLTSQDEHDNGFVSEEVTRLRAIQNALQNNRMLLQTRAIHTTVYDRYRRTRDYDKELAQQCEILLRMEDVNGGLCAPRELLATAERFQMMPELDRWATKVALDAIRLGHPSLVDMRAIFIPISGQSLNDDSFVEFLLDELEDDSLPTENLCFEIAHASLIASIDRTAVLIAKLKEYGCKIALKDFGFTNHAFDLLKRLQVDFLKIDSHFIKNMVHDSVDYEIVLAMIRIAKTLNVQTIAEGVGTTTLKESLIGMGIDYLQGMLIDEPQALELYATG